MEPVVEEIEITISAEEQVTQELPHPHTTESVEDHGAAAPRGRNVTKGPTDAAELKLLHGKDRSNKLQSLRVTRNAAVKIVVKNTGKLRDACQSVLTLHDQLHELKDGVKDDNLATTTIYTVDNNGHRRDLCGQLDQLVDQYKARCTEVRNAGRQNDPELFKHAAVVGYGACAPSSSFQVFEWEHTKLTAFAAEFKDIYMAMFTNADEGENRLKSKGNQHYKKRPREEDEEDGGHVDRVDKLKRARRSAFETRSRVNEALKRQTIRLFERLESISDMLNWTDISSKNNEQAGLAFDVNKAAQCPGWSELRNLTQHICEKAREIRDECKSTSPEVLAKPAVNVFAISGPCSDFKEYEFHNSVNPYFDTTLGEIFKAMFKNENEHDNKYHKKVGRPRVHQATGGAPNTDGVAEIIVAASSSGHD